jgi:hypothetical protein
MDTSVSACLELVTYIDAGRRVIAYQDDAEPRLATSSGQSSGSLFQFGANPCGQRYAIDDLCGHLINWLLQRAEQLLALRRAENRDCVYSTRNTRLEFHKKTDKDMECI